MSRAQKKGSIRLDEPVEFIDLVEPGSGVGEKGREELARIVQRARLGVEAAETLEDALRGILRVICAETGWAVGQAWMPANGTTLRLRAWYSSVSSLDAFCETSASAIFSSGVGLPGNVWARKRPAWIRDAVVDLNPQRAAAARKIGILGAFAVPVLADRNVIAVLEFFSLEPRERDRDLLSMVTRVAARLALALERKAAEDGARRGDVSATGVLEVIPDAVVCVDDDGTVRLWNESAGRMFGRGAAEMTGRPLERVMPERYARRLREAIARAHAHPASLAPGQMFDMHGVRADGKEFPVEIALGASASNPSMVVLAIRDLTQRKQAEHLTEAFLETLARELRDPLTNVIGFTDLLERRAGDMSAEDRRDAVHRIAGNAHRVQELLVALMDIERLRDQLLIPDPRRTDVTGLVREIIDEMNLAGDPSVLVDLDEVVAMVDPLIVRRLVQKLLANRSHPTTARTVWITLRREDDGVLFGIEDDGPAISEDVKRSLFDPDANVEGDHRSIGYALVGRYARAHGGRAWIEDRPGGGVSIRVLLRQL